MKQPLFLILIALAGFIVPTVAVAVEQPNIIIFYVDDLGWQDVEQLNDMGEPCPYETPNLIRLAKRGMNFSQAYSPAPTCAPSRAAILTGQHPAQMDYTHVNAATIPKPSKSVEWQEPFLGSYLDLDHLTLADALSQNGYKTGHVGKWHVGLNASAYGFEFVNQTRGMHRGMGDRTKDFATAKDRSYPLSKKKYPPTSDAFPKGMSYPHDELTEAALEFIGDNKGAPFFLNLCHWMVHWPVLTRNGELLEYYCNKMDQPFPPKKGDMTLEGQQNPYFAAMVTTVDWSLGRVLDVLETTDDPRHPGKKLIDTTYLFFTSDNGGAEYRGKEIISDNFPLKYGKKHTDEGGIRVPMVVSGPGVPAGSESSTLVNQLDYFPTILNLTSAKIDASRKAKLSGLDIGPLMKAETSEVLDANGIKRESLFWHFPHNSMRAAIRKGDYKLYRNFKTGERTLFRLYKNGQAEDLEERTDLAAKPALAEIKHALAEELDCHLETTKAEMPYRNPFFKDATLARAKIKRQTYSKADATATLQLDASGAKATRAYVLYYGKEGEDAKAHKRVADFSKGDPKVGYQIKIPANVDASGYSLCAPVPAEVARVRFLVVDENNFHHFSELTSAN